MSEQSNVLLYVWSWTAEPHVVPPSVERATFPPVSTATAVVPDGLSLRSMTESPGKSFRWPPASVKILPLDVPKTVLSARWSSAVMVSVVPLGTAVQMPAEAEAALQRSAAVAAARARRVRMGPLVRELLDRHLLTVADGRTVQRLLDDRPSGGRARSAPGHDDVRARSR